MNKILRYTSLTAIFLTLFIPLYVNNSLFFPFITGKAFAFRVLVEIAFVFWLLLIIRDREYAPKISWITGAVTLFVGVILVVDLFGLNPLRSLWSNFERMEGWITLIHLWAFLIVSTSLCGVGEHGRRMWHNLMKVSLFVAGVVGVYGFFQLFGWAEIHQGSTRIDASLGNAAYMAVYMLFHVFIALYLGLVEYAKRNKGGVVGYFILAGVFAFLLFETGTRGTILGLVGGLITMCSLFGIFGKSESKKMRWGALGVVLGIIFLGLLIVVAKDTSFVQNNETLRRLSSISINETRTQARGYIWPMAIEHTFSSPKTALFGIGQENFNYVFNSNYDPEMWRHEQWFDRAHNVFLDWLIAGGLIGLGLYLSLFVCVIVAIYKSRLSLKEKCVVVGLIVGYAIHNIFVFDNLASYLMFFLILGFSHSLNEGKRIAWLEADENPSENKSTLRDYIYTPVVIVLFVATLYLVIVRPYQANIGLIQAFSVCNSGKPSAEKYESALKLNQYVANQEIREQLVNCATWVITRSRGTDQATALYNLTIKEIRNQIALTPNDARAYLIGGTFLNNVGDYVMGELLLKKALELSPNKQSIMAELANSYLNTGKLTEALTLVRTAYLMSPDHDEIKQVYASLLIISGDEAKARELLHADHSFWNSARAVNTFTRAKMYDRAIAIVRSYIKNDPNNIQHYNALVAIYYQSGNRQQAITELELIKNKFPELKNSIEASINQIKTVK